MPGGEQHVARRGFEDALRDDDDKTERGGPRGEAVCGATEEFKTHDGGQAMGDSGEAAQAVGGNQWRRCERGQQSPGRR